MTGVRMRVMGDRALLVECGSLEEVMGRHRALEASRPAGVVDLVPAARTILVVLDAGSLSLADVRAWVERTPPAALEDSPGAIVTLPVRYDGPDLVEVADLLGWSPEAVVAWHTGEVWASAFVGFAPGFAYLAPAGSALLIPRRATSRPRVAAGAVGLAAEFTGVYPRESPGGWQLIGTCDVELWDPAATPPALLTPGTRVRFEAVS